MKAVFDTNVLLSALITTGKPKQLLHEAVERKMQLVTSQELLLEFRRVVADPRIRKYVTEEDVNNFLEIVQEVAEVVEIRSAFKVIKADPSDDAVLRTAFDSDADVIVSGDKHLLLLGTFRGIKILTVDQALRSINR